MPYIPMRPLLEYATAHGIAHGAYNVNMPCQAKAIIEAHETIRSGAIIQVAEPGLAYLGGNADFLNGTLEEKRLGAERIANYVRQLAEKATIPVVLHLDHGRSFESVKIAIDAGFSSVMVDGSSLPYEENVALTKKVVDYAHKRGVSVEGELGVLAGTEDDVFAENSSYTNPITAVDFFKRTGCDSLAISYGTKHGAVKGDNVKLRKEIVIATMENMHHEKINGALVSHGSSLVPQYIVRQINMLGGQVSGKGVPVSQLNEVIPAGISKINVDTDIRLAITRNVRKMYMSDETLREDDQVWKLMCEKPQQFDYRYYLAPLTKQLVEDRHDHLSQKYLKPITDGVKEIVTTATVLFGGAGDADDIPVVTLKEMAERYGKGL